jgi:hypothetical protein
MARNEMEGSAADTGEKLKALEAARLQIEKQFGQGSLMKLGTHSSALGVEVIPSGPFCWMRPWASGDIPAAASWRSTARNPPERRRSPCM